jgi:hypothetical protein
LNLNGLQLIDIEHGLAKAENFGLVEDGVVTTSWNGTATSADLFTLVVRANVSASLSELLSVNSRYTTAEAYNTADEQLDVALTFDGKAVAHAGYALYQNTPNPFQGQTMIGFTLPEAAQATITIHDVTGKTLKMIRGDYAQGYANRLHVITTPVAYISKVPDEDPFRPVGVNYQGLAYLNSYEYYDVVGCAVRGGGDTAILNTAFMLCSGMDVYSPDDPPRVDAVVKWVLSCVGPDGREPWQFVSDFGDAQQWIDNCVFYDPTNGTVSRGDIYRSSGKSSFQ